MRNKTYDKHAMPCVLKVCCYHTNFEMTNVKSKERCVQDVQVTQS